MSIFFQDGKLWIVRALVNSLTPVCIWVTVIGLNTLYMFTYVYICLYVCIWREGVREGETETGRDTHRKAERKRDRDKANMKMGGDEVGNQEEMEVGIRAEFYINKTNV